MNNNGPKLVRIPLKTEQEFYKRNIDRRSAGFLCGSWRGFPFWL